MNDTLLNLQLLLLLLSFVFLLAVNDVFQSAVWWQLVSFRNH